MVTSKVIATISKVFISLFSFGLLFFWIYLQFFDDKSQTLNYLFNLFVGFTYLFVGLMTFNYALAEIKPKMKHFLYAYGAALLAWAVAQFIWAYFNFIVKAPVPYPSIADIFYVIYSLLLGLAFWFYFDIFHARITKASIRDSFIILIGVYLTIFFVLFRPQYGLSLPPLEIATNYMYPLLDAMVLSLAFVALRVEKKEEVGNTIYVVIAVFLQVVGDILFSFRSANKLYWNGDISDLFFLLSGIASIVAIVSINKSFKAQLLGKKE